MKINFLKSILVLATFALYLLPAFGQSPEKMSYQAVIRDASDNLVTSQTVGMQISILQGSESGTAVYVETQTPTTNANGLVSVEIGNGTVVSGDFATIDWENGPYFKKTETDPTGSTSYTITGTSQLLSVPYALHAKTADNGITPEQANAIVANTAKVGITTEQADAIVANTAKVGYTDALVSANADVAANTAKIGITTAQADAIIANTAKVGVTSGTQAGQMQYWNGSSWITISAGGEGQVLTFVSGAPTWATQVGPNDVVSTTGKIWMDRNLGATQVATSSTDAASYGDLYQWGRGTDGHQIRTSPTTATLSTTDNPGNGNFITINSAPYDWRSTQNDNLWQGVNGVNNPCPSGYRLPTETEINAERTSWSTTNAAGAFASPLKLPMAGYRFYSDGSLVSVGAVGHYWSSSVSSTDSRSLGFSSSYAHMYTNYRAIGFSVRCLKD